MFKIARNWQTTGCIRAYPNRCYHPVFLSFLGQLRCVSSYTTSHYDVLGVSATSSKKEIKEAFIKKTKLTHPDLHPNNESKHKQFVAVNEAYSVLRDGSKRKLYDDSLNPISGSYGADSSQFDNDAKYRPDPDDYAKDESYDFQSMHGEQSKQAGDNKDRSPTIRKFIICVCVGGLILQLLIFNHKMKSIRSGEGDFWLTARGNTHVSYLQRQTKSRERVGDSNSEVYAKQIFPDGDEGKPK